MAEYPLADAYLPPGGIPGGKGSAAANESQGSEFQAMLRQFFEDDAPIQRRAMRISGEVDAEVGTLGRMRVRGDTEVLGNGQFRSGQTDFDTGNGFFFDYNDGAPRMSLGSAAGNKITWDGTSLSITGAITATSGSIGGWTIGATTITGGTVTLDSAGNIRAGQTAYNTGTGFFLGVVAGASKFSLGSPTGPRLTWDGATLTIAQATIVLSSGGAFGDSIKWQNAGNDKGSIYADASTFYVNTQTADLSIGAGSGKDTAVYGDKLTLASDTDIIDIRVGLNPVAQWETTNRALSLYGRLFPGTGSASQPTGYLSWVAANSSIAVNVAPLQVAFGIYPGNGGTLQFSRFFSDNGTDLVVNGNSLLITGNSAQPGLKFTNIANGGSASNWSSFTVANIPDKAAGYMKVQIAGTNYRVPIYADA